MIRNAKNTIFLILLINWKKQTTVKARESELEEKEKKRIHLERKIFREKQREKIEKKRRSRRRRRRRVRRRNTSV